MKGTKLIKYLFNTEVAKKSRLPWVDYAKGIAIILVAYRHILIGFERSGLEIHKYLLNANEIFYSFRMPLFFILSGVFITTSLEKRGLRKLLENKWKTLLYPYIIWAIIQITLQIIFAKYTNANRTFKDYTYILLQPDALDQLWYLFALFNVAFVYVVLKAYVHIKAWQQLVLGIILHSLSLIINFGPWHDLLYYYLFYALGDLISIYLLKNSLYNIFGSWKTFFTLLPIFTVSQWYFINHESVQYTHIYVFAFIALSGCAFMLNICFKLQKWGRLTFLKIIGYYSLYVYVMHVMIVSFFRSFFTNIVGIHSVAFLLILNLSLGIGLSIIIYNFAIRSGLWFLFTLDKNRVHTSPQNKTNQTAKIENKKAVSNLQP
ncbi:MAG TPA: acyltransferase [Candidatus Babeliaceae bacterium]|nr:acyltransferase [Candidatus Babeliaceae bacterium]